MAEYIEREAALHEIERRESLMVGDKCVSVDAIKSFIKNRPAADVAPVVHGRWEAKGYVCGESEFECSVCHKSEWRTSIGRFRWCPFCGARMDGGSYAKEN